MINHDSGFQEKNYIGNKHGKVSVLDITLVASMVAIIEVCKFALISLPNIEMTSFWIILFTLVFGYRIVFVLPVFILIEGFLFGFGTWWISYLYTWPILAWIAWIFRSNNNRWFWAIISAEFGLAFGALCSISYTIIASGNNGIKDGLTAGFLWWIAGIPWDIAHCVGNFVVMLFLYTPVINSMRKLNL